MLRVLGGSAVRTPADQERPQAGRRERSRAHGPLTLCRRWPQVGRAHRAHGLGFEGAELGHPLCHSLTHAHRQLLKLGVSASPVQANGRL